MSERSTEHATFVIERALAAAPQRAFAAWATVEAKSKWFGPPSMDGYDFEFRPGGHERFVADVPDGARYRYDALYHDVVPEERIVYTYEMYRDEDRISVSVATIEFAAGADGGTAMTVTEQGVYLDGHDTAAIREHGTRELLEKLAKVVSG
ncbi:MAG TPA: SRPBCC domain-containing protein [Solirubrobacteraceae bacterium]|nr:SRPBCC domain-containing protein [Solirubrobacteraceae bacterium]